MGCDEENYQKDLHDLFLVWNQLSRTPLFIGECGHERTRHPTNRSNMVHQKSSSNRMPLFNARGPDPARRATVAPLGVPPPYAPPIRGNSQRRRSRCTLSAVTGRASGLEIPWCQPSSRPSRPARLRHASSAPRRKLGTRTGGWDAPTRNHQAESSGFTITKNRKATRGPLMGV